MATLHLLPNLTYGGWPYALVEIVVTRRAHHGQGLWGFMPNWVLMRMKSAE